jgi:6 kDa early secretory antigenic target
MGDQNIKVSFGSLEALAGDIGRRVGEIEGDLKDLEGKIKHLEEIWVGSASAGFQATKASWNQSADHLRGVLAKIQTAVMQSTDNYRDVEDRNKRRWDL